MRQFLLSLLLLTNLAFGQKQTAPRPQGNFFTFTPQQAKNTLLVSRFPSGWTNPSSRVFIMGFGVPFTGNAAENLRRFTNAGFTHGERNTFVDRLNLPMAKRFRMLTDADAKNVASAWAATLPDSDSRKAHLVAYGNNRAITSTDWTLWRELGKRTYLSGRGNGLGLVGFDIEVFADNTPLDYQHEFQQAANLGMLDGISQSGDNAKVFQYGGSLSRAGIVYAQNKEGDGYMVNPGPDWTGSNGKFNVDANPLATSYRQPGVYTGRDQYFRNTYDDRSYYQKNGDGSILTSGGMAVWRRHNYPNDKVTNYGFQSIVYSDEAQIHAQMIYEEVEKILADWRWMCNTPLTYNGVQIVGTIPFPKGPSDPRPGLENKRLCGWFRDETESVQMFNSVTGQGEFHETSNNRPLYHRAIRYAMLMRSLLYHGNIIWSDKAYADYTQGANFSKEQGGQMVPQRALAMGQFEAMIAGNYQAKNFPVLFDLMDQHKIDFVIPKKPILSGNTSVEEQEANKPLIWGMKETAGRRAFFTWVYPTQDVGNAAHNTEIKAWIVLDNGTTSGSWTLLCKDRDAGYDSWTIPSGFEGAKAENWRFQFTSILGTKFTWTGNYNVPWSGPHPTPPAPITRAIITSNGGAQ